MKRGGERIYLLALRLLPGWLREKHGEAMAHLFRRQLGEARARGGWLAAFGVTAGAVMDVMKRSWIERRGGGTMGSLRRDIGHALRTLVRAPGFALATVATLTLGIGGAIAIFTVVDGVMLRPLPFPEADRVTHLAWARRGGLVPSMPYYKVHFWRERSRTFDGITTSTVLTRSFGDDADAAVPIRALGVDHDFFTVVGLEPALGRALTTDDQRPGAEPVALLTHNFWTDQLGADPDALGRTVRLSGRPHTVVGILGEDFVYPYADGALHALIPLAMEPDPTNESENFLVVARLADGVTPSQAEADLDRVWSDFQREHAGIVNETDDGMRLASYTAIYVGRRAGVLWVLLGAIGMVLLIVCANVASLFMARTADRRREMAVRSALGASRGAIVRQLLTESVVLALLGGGLGLVAATVGVDLLLAMNPDPLPRTDEIGLDGRVVGFAAVIIFLTAALFGLPAALPAGKQGIRGSMGGRGNTTTSGGRQVLIGVEAALSMVLLVGAGLLVATFFRLASSDPGYDANDVVALSFPGLSQQIQGPDALLSIESTALAAVRDLPGVAGAGWSSSLPLERGLNLPVGPDDRPDEVIGGTEWRAVSPGYLDAMDLVLVAGRDFAVEDVMGGEPVTLVNEAFAEAFFASGAVGERIAIGRYRGRFISPTFEAPPSRIVGIVQDQRDISLRAEARPTVYVPRAQMLPALASPGQLIVEGRWGKAAIDQVIATLAREIPELPAPEVKPLGGIVAASLGSERFHATLLGAFAMLALALTSMGIVGVVSYDVRKRRREIGIRLALGEGAGRVVRQVAGQGMRPIAIGLVVGAGASLYLARTLEALLWGVEPTDPATLMAVAALLAGVSLVAAWLPARGAARANPVEALRSE